MAFTPSSNRATAIARGGYGDSCGGSGQPGAGCTVGRPHRRCRCSGRQRRSGRGGYRPAGAAGAELVHYAVANSLATKLAGIGRQDRRAHRRAVRQRRQRSNFWCSEPRAKTPHSGDRGVNAYPFGRQPVEAPLGSRPVSLSDRTINRDDFVAVDHGVNSVGPMLHQLGARCDQGERPDPVIDRLDTPLV
jgi:hypothetical protein